MSAGNVAQNAKASDYSRAAGDWYVEPRWCVEQLADAITFAGDVIWDPCAGSGTIPDVFLARGHRIRATDLVDRGYEHLAETWDATQTCSPGAIAPGERVDVVMNPPFKLAEAIIRRMLNLADHRVCVLQQLSFLASRGRHALFSEFPPAEILILSQRPSMPPGEAIAALGERAFRGGTTDFCWIVWNKPHNRETRTRWLPIDRTLGAALKAAIA